MTETNLIPYDLPQSLVADEGVRVRTPHLDTRPTRKLQRPDEDKPQLAQLRLIQKKDKPFDGCEPGHYALTSTQETFEKALVIPYDYLDDAQVWRPPFDPNLERQKPPYCWSDRGDKPGVATERRQMTNRQDGQRCFVLGDPEAGCPLNKWDRTTTPNTPPQCTRVRRFMVGVATPDGNIHTAQYAGWRTAMKNIKNELTPKVEAGACGCILIFGSEYIKEKGGYYVPKFTRFRDLTEAGCEQALTERADAWAQIERGDVAVVPAQVEPEVEEESIPF